jgi:MFS-type transporter involved in bile tolerance (Atg22 family)
MTGALVSAIGERRAAALAGVLVCAALIVFALSPTFGAAAAGVMLISVAISFGYAAQSAYYSGRAAARGFGIGRAMGVYAIFDNAGQTLGPMAYAAAMLAGDRAAAGMAGAVLGGAIGAFLLVTAKKKRAFARK